MNSELLQQLDPQILELLKQRNIPSLYPIQEEAIEKGLTGQNLIISIPTASGKTLIAEIIALQKLFSLSKQTSRIRRKKILYLCPLKALASEKYKEFSKPWQDSGFKVGISTSDIDQQDFRVFSNDLILLTNEKADSLLRMNSSLIHDIALIICDEIHLINDQSRGPTLELLLTRILALDKQVQIIGLSATIKNSDELSKWIKGELIASDWRPITLKEGYFINNMIHFKDGTSRHIQSIKNQDDVAILTMDMIKEGGQVLIFNNSRRSAISTAEKLQTTVKLISSTEEREIYSQIQNQYESFLNDNTDLSKKLGLFLGSGVAFHHAGLNHAQLDFIVECFNDRKIKLISSTPTLAAGVNTPARRVIIKTLYRFNADLGSVKIPIMEYKQMAGRAGRPKYDPYGEVVIIGSNPEKLEQDALDYINGDTEKIFSRLDEKNTLTKHILSLITTKIASSKESLQNFLANSFLYFQKEHQTPESMSHLKNSSHELTTTPKKYSRPKAKRVGGRGSDPLKMHSDENIFVSATDVLKNPSKHGITYDFTNNSNREDIQTYLQNQIRENLKLFYTNGLIEQDTSEISSKDDVKTKEMSHNTSVSTEKKELQFKGTSLGMISTRMYINPLECISIAEDLKYAECLKETGEVVLNHISWLYMVAKLQSFRTFYIRKEEWGYIKTFIEDHEANFILEEIWEFGDPEYKDFAQNVKLVMILDAWINESKEQEIIENFNIGAGDLYNSIQTAQWLFRVVREISKLPKYDQFSHIFENFYLRIQHGIKANLISLVEIKGIGRIRARKLYHEGFKTIQDLKLATIEEISRVPLIGIELAKKIKEQIFNPKPLSITNEKPSSTKKKNKKSISKESIRESKKKSLDDFFK